jgi:hypothetical protein
MQRMLRLVVTSAVLALLITAGASSRPASGISVTVAPVMVALNSLDIYSGVATVSYVTAARWSPEASQEQVSLTFRDVTENAESGAGTPPCCNRLHSSNRYSDVFSAFEGHRYEITAKWQVYNVGGASGSGTSTTKYKVPGKEPAPRLTDQQKRGWVGLAGAMITPSGVGIACLVALGVIATPLGIALAVYGAIHIAVGLYALKQAFDPVDLNFRSIAKPKIPVVPKVAAGEGLPAASARVLNDLFAVQAREIGLGRAIATAFDRSQGAHVKKQTTWEKRQVQAAGRYAAQLASALLADASLRPKVNAALADSGLADLTLTYEDALASGESLVWKGFPAEVKATLAKLGLTRAEQNEMRAQLATTDPGLYDGDVLGLVANPRQIGLLRNVAAGLKAFSNKAAKNPLATRPP